MLRGSSRGRPKSSSAPFPVRLRYLSASAERRGKVTTRDWRLLNLSGLRSKPVEREGVVGRGSGQSGGFREAIRTHGIVTFHRERSTACGRTLMWRTVCCRAG